MTKTPNYHHLHYPHTPGHDLDARAERIRANTLTLAILDGDGAAFCAAVEEINDCPGCRVGVMHQLAQFAAKSMRAIADQQGRERGLHGDELLRRWRQRWAEDEAQLDADKARAEANRVAIAACDVCDHDGLVRDDTQPYASPRPCDRHVNWGRHRARTRAPP